MYLLLILAGVLALTNWGVRRRGVPRCPALAFAPLVAELSRPQWLRTTGAATIRPRVYERTPNEDVLI